MAKRKEPKDHPKDLLLMKLKRNGHEELITREDYERCCATTKPNRDGLGFEQLVTVTLASRFDPATEETE